MSDPTKGEHVQTSTIVGASSQLPLTGDTLFDGFPSISDDKTYIFGLDEQGVRQETINGKTLCPPVIPPTHANRTLVVCFDGTGDEFDNDNSNIVQLAALMKKDDRHQQLVYYQVRRLPLCVSAA